MRPEGSGASGVYVCAEALGEHEAKDGLPLRPNAPAGSVFDRTLRRASISRESLAISNTIHCRPGPKNFLEHAPYEFEAINHCRQHMDREIQQFRPKVIVALGGIPLRTLTGYCGSKQSITNVRGFYLDGLRYPGIPVLGTYHPAHVARDKPNLLGVFRMDLLRAVALAKAGGQFTRPVKRYVKFPNISEAETWERWLRLHPELLIVRDIETSDSITGEDESALRVNADGVLEYSPLKEEFVDLPAEEKEKEEAIASEYKYTSTDIRITQIQFSVLGEMDAIILPWDNGPFSALASRVMALPNMKAGWNNWGFDDVVAAMVGECIGGINHDAMWMFHHLQPDLPRGLQYGMSFYFPEAEPWKHKAADDLGEYGGDDVSYLRIAVPKLIQALKDRGIWAGYERHVLGLHPILVGATKRGIPVDDARRVELGERVDRLKVGVDAELQGMFPDELRGCEPKQGYVNPKIAAKRKEGPDGGLEEGERWAEREFVGRSSQRKVAAIAGEDDFGAIGGGLVDLLSNDEKSQQSDAGSVSGVYGGKVLEQESGEKGGSDGGGGWGENAMGGIADNKVTRWCRIQPFLPNSSQQILKYIRWRRGEEVEAKIATYRGNSRWAGWPDRALREMAERNAVYKVPKKWKEDKDTTEKKELERLGAKTGDRFFSLVVEHREYGKVKSTYVDGWRGADDGRTHPTFGFAPATGQLSSVRPASMTMPKPGGQETLAEARKTELAHRCRGMVVAPPGYKLVFFDKRSFHATTLGFNAQDPLYLRITKKDIHSFVTANFMWMNERAAFLGAGLPANPESWINRGDEELGELLGLVKGRWKAIRDKKAKPTILGIGLGLGDAKCFELNRRDEVNPKGFDSKAEVTKFKNVLKGLFPPIFRFHERVLIEAEDINKGFLKSRHGFMRWFFDIFKYEKTTDNRWARVRSGDCEAAIAFHVQNDAHGMLKEEMLEMEGLGMMEKFGFCNVVHDEIQFCCPDRWVEECLIVVPQIMNQPSRILVDPVVAPGGLVCEAEASVGQDWDSMREVKVGKLEEIHHG